MDLLARIAEQVLNVPLALLPKKAAVVAQVLGPRVGLKGDMEGFVGSIAGPPVARRGANSSGQAAYAKMGGVALIPVVGSLISRGSYLEAESGLVSYDRLKSAILAADRDADVTSIVLDLDTPGGVAAGAFECADVIYQVSRRRPVVAVANQMACSAGYAIAAAANRIVAAPSAVLGSIGVIALHVDYSRNLDAKGITPTLIHAGAHKADASPYEPLSDGARLEIQREVDHYMGLFVSGVAKHRPRLSVRAIRDMEARTFVGAETVSAGLADQLGTIEDVVSELAQLHGKATAKFEKYDKIERLYGKTDALHARLDDAHAAGVRKGMAAALRGERS